MKGPRLRFIAGLVLTTWAAVLATQVRASIIIPESLTHRAFWGSAPESGGDWEVCFWDSKKPAPRIGSHMDVCWSQE